MFLFYLGCFDNGALEKTWCFLVVVCWVITLWRIWFIFSLGEFLSLFSSNASYFYLGNLCLYDLYSSLENLYHFSCRMIYSLSGICIILLIVWFILPLGCVWMATFEFGFEFEIHWFKMPWFEIFWF